MSKFIDLYIRPENDLDYFFNLIIKLKDFNYTVIGLDQNKYSKDYFEICHKEKIKVIARTEILELPKGSYIKYLQFKNKKETLELARRFRFDFLTVDLDKIKEIDEKLLNFISQRKVCVEIVYNKIFQMDLIKDKDNLLLLKDVVEKCYKKGIKIIFSSGASKIEEIRNAIDVASFFKSIGLKKYNLERLFKEEIINEILER